MPTPPYLQPFVLDVPTIHPERQENIDIYRPQVSADHAAHPVVLLVHGGPLQPDLRPTPRDWPVYVGYGSALAQQGVVAVTVDHRLFAPTAYPTAAGDVRAAVELARALDGVDEHRVGLWFFSGGGLLSADWLAERPAWLRCLAMTYPLLAPPPDVGVPDQYQPIRALSAGLDLPLLITRVGRERAEIADTVAEFVATAQRLESTLTVLDVPDGQHGFDMLDHDDDSRHAVQQALTWVTEALRSP